ncbi:hypothetical protein Efla_002367 [Eimeria flavescens]
MPPVDIRLAMPQTQDQQKKPICSPPASRCYPRFLILSVYCIYGFLTGAAYFNWTPMADMLQRDGAFEWLCSSSDLDVFAASGAPLTRPRCRQQELALGRLFSVMSAAEFSFAAFSGFLFDAAGPKITSCVGVLMALGGWVLLAAAGETFNSFLAAAVLLGGSSEMCFYPMLPAANLFPGRESAVLALFGAFRSLSFVIPLLLRAVYLGGAAYTLQNVLLGFAGFCLVGCFFLAIFFFPFKAWPREGGEEEEGEEATDKPTETGDVGACSVELKENEEKKEETSSSSFSPPSPSASPSASSSSASSFSLSSCCSLYLQEVFTVRFLPMACAYTLVILMIMFYVPSTFHLIPHAYAANQVIQIFSFLPCPLLGLAADRFGILWVMQFLNFCGFAAYFFVIVPKTPNLPFLQFLSAICCSIQVSFMNSQLYCYGSKYLSQRNLGKLIGTAFCFSGFVSLLTNPLRAFALQKGFRGVCYLMLALSVVVAVVLAFLQLLDNKQQLRRPEEVNKKNKKSKDKEQKRGKLAAGEDTQEAEGEEEAEGEREGGQVEGDL